MSDLDQRVIEHGVAWARYQSMLAARGENPVPRFTYLEGALEQLRPSRSHESTAKRLGSMFEAYALEQGIVFDGYGSMTMRSAPDQRGAEPDECYAIGGKKDRPDLAIEVIWTSGGLDKLEVYRGLGIGELWLWNDNAISVYVLRGADYERVPKSEAVPGIDLALIAELIARGESQSTTLRAFLENLRKR